MELEETKARKSHWLWRAIKTLFWIIVLLIVTGFSVVGYWGETNWHLDTLSHFRLQYFAAAAGLFLLLLFFRRWVLLCFATALLAFNAWTVFSIPDFRELDGLPVYRAVSINVYSGNPHINLVIDFIKKEKPDFVALIEIKGTWRPALEALKADYPYQEVKIWGHDFGYCLLSRYPFTDRKFGYVATGSLVREIETPSGRFVLLQAHPLSPTNEKAWKWRNQTFESLAKFAKTIDEPILLLGDMNCTPWSPNFQKFTEESGLHTPNVRWLPRRTWPNAQPFLWIPIDHFFLSDGLVAVDERVGSSVGSDHYPIVLDFAFEAKD
ncbi:endonuclease/exonuclease/phosphatase family protein [Rubellicoccus peritrichatus]|uniref:Endonuclease/exonuclease/phosphatase family protein n=1 Tax=Rubellicoccus peritrichatus TaxID=3080537 RepID=A0AAQ3QU07_9BACT|nr:endonuclease/exonuclease/phosphatase family protein [Puniceicoccus sp. CR14]WOO41911.1 endonuclease/exonuclease/phosphatase family protein [Puniceicoccus sp. CR14]